MGFLSVPNLPQPPPTDDPPGVSPHPSLKGVDAAVRVGRADKEMDFLTSEGWRKGRLLPLLPWIKTLPRTPAPGFSCGAHSQDPREGSGRPCFPKLLPPHGSLFCCSGSSLMLLGLSLVMQAEATFPGGVRLLIALASLVSWFLGSYSNVVHKLSCTWHVKSSPTQDQTPGPLALVGGFLTIGPPGKSSTLFFFFF